MPNSVLKEEPAKSKGRDNLFLWTVFLLLLAALVFACWLGSFYIFGHPEHPKAYRILQKLGKLPSPTRFVVTKAPPGEFLEAQRVFERYSKYTALQMKRENELLFRCYLKNYTETKKVVPYLTGRFVILRAYELQRGDLLSSGVVVLTQAVDFPQLLAEVVYPVPKERVSDVLALLQPGLELRLQRTLDLSAIVQICHAPEGRLQVSVFPLLYGSYALKNGVGSFSLEPPTSLNVAAGFPLVRGEEVRSVMRENLRRKAVVKGAAPNAPEHSGEIVRVDGLPGAPVGNASSGSLELAALEKGVEPGLVASGTQALSAVIAPQLGGGGDQRTASALEGAPEAPGAGDTRGSSGIPKVEAVSKAEAVPKVEAVSKADAAPKGEAAARGNPGWMSRVFTNSGTVLVAANGGDAKKSGTNPEQANALPAKVPPVAPVAGAVSAKTPDQVKAAPKPAVATTAGVSAAQGAVPPSGNAASAQGSGAAKPFLAASPAPSTTQATGTWKTYSGGKYPAGKSVTAEQATSLQGRNDGAPIYLHGRFTVTASGNNRVVLRQAGAGEAKGQPRVIVEYPAGAVPPRQGAAVAREDGRGFEIREVRRTPDGQVNIFVREVSAP
jgi:hypothetical protein